MTSPNPDPLSAVESYLLGDLDDDGAEVLLNKFADDPDFGSRVLQIIRVDRLLRDHFEILKPDQAEQHTNKGTSSSDSDLDFESLVSLEKTSAIIIPRSLEKPETADVPVSSTLGQTRSINPIGAGLSAAILFIGLAFGIYNEWFSRGVQNHSDERIIARIVESIEAEWEKDSPSFKNGQGLESGNLRLRSGVIKLEFVSGAEVVLEGPTEFLVRNKESGFCRLGRLSVFVPPRAVGFEIASPLATVVDLGTRFSMQISDNESQVHVIDGKVEVGASRKDRRTLTERLGLVFDLCNEPKTISADPKTFVDDARIQERKASYAKSRQAVWEQQLARMGTDPSSIYRLVPDDISHIRTIPGSRDGRKAVCFRKARDRIDLVTMKECSSLTLLASVRLRDMRNPANTLLMGNDFYQMRGAVHWQLNRFGILQFHISNGKTAMMFDSDPVFKREDCNTWMTLAVVVDAEKRTITHFLDGRPVKTLPWKKPIPLKLDQLAIGNQWVGSRHDSVRFFNGDIEDFRVFDRPLSAQEIRQYHEDNR